MELLFLLSQDPLDLLNGDTLIATILKQTQLILVPLESLHECVLLLIDGLDRLVRSGSLVLPKRLLPDLLEEASICLCLCLLEVVLELLSGLIKSCQLLVELSEIFLILGEGCLLVGCGLLELLDLPVKVRQLLLAYLDLGLNACGVLYNGIKLGLTTVALGQGC